MRVGIIAGVGLFGLFGIGVTGCSGGGGTSAGGSPLPIATATPSPTSLSGSVKDRLTSTALAGFTVTIGVIPTVATCNVAQTQTLNVCGAVASPIASATTQADGTFAVANLTPGAYMVSVGRDGTYAMLHRTITLAAGANALGAVGLTALTADEQAWLIDVNRQRATVSAPVSFANMAVDEYAEEQARQWAADIVSGKTVFGDAGYAPYQAAYAGSSGAMYGAGGVLELNGPAAFISADNVWMLEKANCPGGLWQGCAFPATASGETGHYINFSNTNSVWVGLGESATSFAGPLGTNWAYNIMFIENVNGPAPAAHRREHL